MKKTLLFRSIFTSLFMMLCITNLSAQGIISTIAGTGSSGFSGDGGEAILATFSSPSGVALDNIGNIYIADKYNHRVRMISAITGNISTVAGNSAGGYAGMGGPAGAATLFYPNAMFVDASGSYYFTDWFNDASFKVEASTHHIHNHCGHHTQGYTGDDGDAPDATMELPDGICLDNEFNAYIVDAGSNHIRRVDGATNIVTTVCGGTYGYSGDGGPASLATFNGVSGVATDNHGNIYISDRGNNCIRRIDATGTIYTIAGTGVAGYSGDGGTAQMAKLYHPGGLFINNAGYLFICDIGNNVIRVLNTNMCTINTLAGNGTAGFSGDSGPAASAALNGPTGVWQQATTGDIFIADAGNNRIRRVMGAGYKTSPNLENELTQSHFEMFPNPTSGSFTILTNSVKANSSVEVYNIVGQKVFAQSITQQQTNINLNLPNGLYNVALKSNEGVSFQKLTIQN